MNLKVSSRAKRCLAAIFSIAIVASSATIVNAATDKRTDEYNGVTMTSSAIANRTAAAISSSTTNNTSGNHKITYRAMATEKAAMVVKTESKGFGGTGGSIIKSGLYLVDYVNGSHTYNFTGTSGITVYTRAEY